MKTKFLALIALLVCFATVLVSCGDDAIAQSECSAPIDEDMNGKCDVCGHDYVNPEDKVEMVVNPIPTDVNESEYFKFTQELSKPYAENPTPLIGSPAAEGGNYQKFIVTKHIGECNKDGSALKGGESADQIYKRDTYMVYDFTAKEAIYTVYSETYKEGEPRIDKYEFQLYDYYSYVKTTKTSVNDLGDVIEEHSWRFFTATGEFIREFDKVDSRVEDLVGDVFYLSVNDVIVAIDVETGANITPMNGDNEKIGDVDTFVKRPAFDYVQANYGYVIEKDSTDNTIGLQVYDLNTWIDCIYAYDVPSYVNPGKTAMFFLQNGNVFMKTVVPLHANTVNYDFMENGIKYDMVYTIINPFDKAETKVEFGYDIEYVYVGTDVDFATEKATNVALIYPIVNEKIDRTAAKIVALDNDLNILASLTKYLPAQTDPNRIAVGNNLYIVTLMIGQTINEAVVDGNGELRAYLPEYNSFIKCEDFIVAGEKIYSYDMQQKVDIYKEVGKDWEIVKTGSDFLIIRTKSENDSMKYDYFYYNSSLRTPTKIVSANSAQEFAGSLGSGLFVIRDTSSGAPVYTIYNSEYKRVFISFLQPNFIYEQDGMALVESSSILYVFETK